MHRTLPLGGNSSHIERECRNQFIHAVLKNAVALSGSIFVAVERVSDFYRAMVLAGICTQHKYFVSDGRVPVKKLNLILIVHRENGVRLIEHLEIHKLRPMAR